MADYILIECADDEALKSLLRKFRAVNSSRVKVVGAFQSPTEFCSHTLADSEQARQVRRMKSRGWFVHMVEGCKLTRRSAGYTLVNRLRADQTIFLSVNDKVVLPDANVRTVRRSARQRRRTRQGSAG